MCRIIKLQNGSNDNKVNKIEETADDIINLIEGLFETCDANATNIILG